MNTPFNGLTPRQAELLDLLAEECSEVIQIIMKIKRHGYDSRHPHDPVITNRDNLMKELGDVSAAVEFLKDSNELFNDYMSEAAERAKVVKPKWLHHYTDPK